MTDLLCFVHNKLECVPIEKLKSIIVAGFQEDVVVAVPGAAIFDVFNGLQNREELNVTNRAHRQTGKSSIDEMNVQDILIMKLLSESTRLGTSLPKYAAVNLNALPRIPFRAHVSQPNIGDTSRKASSARINGGKNGPFIAKARAVIRVPRSSRSQMLTLT